MPTKSHNVPVYGLHKATGQARVVLDGRCIYLGKYGTEESRQEYDRVIMEWIANRRRLVGEPGGPSQLTVIELLFSYLGFAESYYVKEGGPTSELACIRLAIRPLQKLYNRLPIADFSPLKLKAVRQEMIGSGLSRGVVNHHISRLKRIFRWGVENELVPPSVYHGLQAVRGLPRGRSDARETEPVTPVPEEHVEAIRLHCSPTVWAMIQLQLLTGMRPGEVRTMRGCGLDMAGRVWEYRPERHKTEHHSIARIVLLGPGAQRVIRPFLKVDREAYLFSPEETVLALALEKRKKRKTRARARKAPQRSGRRRYRLFYTKDAYATAIRRACRRAGVPEWSPNQLRHNSATRVRRMFGLEAAQAWLGHQQARTTEIYAERNTLVAREVATKLG